MSGPNPAGGAPFGDGQMGGRRKTRRNGMSVKALKRALKKAGLKTTGKKAALTKRAKKAHLMRGGDEVEDKKAAAKTALENAVKNDGDVETARQNAIAAGWSEAEADSVIEAANAEKAAAAGQGGRRRPRKGRRGGFDY